MLDVALRTAALIVVPLVMNGFQKEVWDCMLSALAHIEVMVSNSLPNWQCIVNEAVRSKEVIDAVPYMGAQTMITRDEAMRGVLLRRMSLADEPKMSDTAKNFKSGMIDDLKPDGFGIALDSQLTNGLGVYQGNKVTLAASQGIITPAGVLSRLRQSAVTGIFESGHCESDSSLALINMDGVEYLFRLGGPTGVHLKLVGMDRALQVAEALSRTLSGELYIRDWSR